MNGSVHGPLWGAYKSMTDWIGSQSSLYHNQHPTMVAQFRFLAGLVVPLSRQLKLVMDNPEQSSAASLYAQEFKAVLQHLRTTDNHDRPVLRNRPFRGILIPVPTPRSAQSWEITTMGALADLELLSSPSNTSQMRTEEIVTIGMIGGLILSLDKGRRDVLEKTLTDAPNFRDLALLILKEGK